MYTPLKVICIVFHESKHTIIFGKNIILIISLIEKILSSYSLHSRFTIGFYSASSKDEKYDEVNALDKGNRKCKPLKYLYKINNRISFCCLNFVSSKIFNFGCNCSLSFSIYQH